MRCVYLFFYLKSTCKNAEKFSAECYACHRNATEHTLNPICLGFSEQKAADLSHAPYNLKLINKDEYCTVRG